MAWKAFKYKHPIYIEGENKSKALSGGLPSKFAT